jgi:hypothetical protein
VLFVIPMDDEPVAFAAAVAADLGEYAVRNVFHRIVHTFAFIVP